eukprot:scaffold27816_cov89-Skeletonema_dohrnii-CCMP3373.AAC.1
MAAIVRSPFIDFKTYQKCRGKTEEERNLLRTFQSQVDLGLGCLSLIGIDIVNAPRPNLKL